MTFGARIWIVLGCCPSAGAVYTELSGDCVTRVSTHGPYGHVLQTLTNIAIAGCEANCDADASCSGFSYTPGSTNLLGECVLKDDEPYAGWCDTGIPGRENSGPCTSATCFHAKSLLPEGYYIEHMDHPPYGYEACQQKCAANSRGGRLTDTIASEAVYNALAAVLGSQLDTVIGYRQASGAEEPAGGWTWDSPCAGFQPPWHSGVSDPGLGHDEPNNWSPRLELHENCATMWDGKLSDVTCEWNTEMNWLPTECLCQDSLPCTTTTTTTIDPNAAIVAPAIAPVAPAIAPVAPAIAPVAPAIAPVAPAIAPVAPAIAPVAPAIAPVAPAIAPPTTISPVLAAITAAGTATVPPSSPQGGSNWVPIVIATGCGLLLVGAVIFYALAQTPAKKKQTRAAKKEARTVKAPRSQQDPELAPLAPSAQVPLVPFMVRSAAPLPTAAPMATVMTSARSPAPLPTAAPMATVMTSAPLAPVQFVTVQGMQPAAQQLSVSLPVGQASRGGYAMLPVASPMLSRVVP